MSKPLVSIIVPCYKLAAFLPEALTSVLSQTYQHWECIVVDDGSPDNTREITHEFCLKDSRIKYLFQPNAGVAMARNNGIRHSSGEYIVPLDADDRLFPDFLEKCVSYFQNHPDTTIVYGDYQKFGISSDLWKSPKYSYEKIIWGNIIFNTSMYKRIDFDKTVGYNPNMVHGYEDWDFWLSLLGPESKVHCIPKPMFFYRIQDSSRAVSNSQLQNWKESHRQIYLNHLEIYAQYVLDIIMLHNKEQDLKHILNSKAYLWGERIARIYRKIRYRE